MGSTADAAGVGPTITHKGKAYRVSPVTPVIVGRFEVWLEERGDQYIGRHADRWGPARARQEADAHRRDCVTDVYAHGGAEFRRMAATPAGLSQALLVCLREANGGDPAVTPELVNELFAAQPREAARALETIGWAVFQFEDEKKDEATPDAVPAG